MEELLAHRGWVQRLAASLVPDPANADDVVQETWLTALEGKPYGTLHLRVLDDHGAGCERVMIVVRTGATMSNFPGTHLGGGVHEILLDPGKLVVQVTVSGYHIESIHVEIAEGHTLEREIRLTPFRR